MKNNLEEISELENNEKGYKTIESDVPTFDDKTNEIEIKLDSEGKPEAMAFYDIDGTLGNFKDMHREAIKRLYPDHNPEEVFEEFYKGISLGTTYRVHDRLIQIFEDGKDEFKDPEKYMEWFSDHRKEVDESGPIHDKAGQYSMKHSQMSGKIAEELYEKDPSYFEKTKIAPVFHLAKLYKRLGIPQTLMTANDSPFAKSICKCLDLGDSFITMAHQGDFEGRGKDGAIEVIIERMKEKGIPVPEKLIVVGDSQNGDIGSGAVFNKEHTDFDVTGVLVTEGDVEEVKQKVDEDKNLKDMNVEVLNPNEVTMDEKGVPQLAKYRKEHGIKNN